MANLTPAPGWDEVFQLETDTPVLGGAGGVANSQAQALLNRTAFLEGATGSSKVGHTPEGIGAVAATVKNKLQESVSVRDFGALGDGVNGDSSAFQLALDSGAMRVIVPYTGQEYVLDLPISIPRGVTLEGDTKDQPSIKCLTTTTTNPFISVDGYGRIKNLRIYGESTAQGTLCKIISAAGEFNFTGNIEMENVRFAISQTGLFVNSVFNVKFKDCQFIGNQVGVDASPLTNGGDNGYINRMAFDNCYWIDNSNYDFYANPAVRISVLSFKDCTFDPGATIAKVYVSTGNPVSFKDCYFEGGTTVPAIFGRLSTIVCEDSYLLSTLGWKMDSTVAGSLRLKRNRTTATEIIDCNSSIHIVRLEDQTLAASGNIYPVASTKYWDNSVVNGITYNFRSTPTSFTPVLSGETTAGTPTYTAQVGRFSVNGNICTYAGRVSISALGGLTGLVRISLPLPCANISNVRYLGTLDASGVTLSGGNTYFYTRIEPNQSFLRLYQGGVTSTHVVDGNLSAATTLFFSIQYEITIA